MNDLEWVENLLASNPKQRNSLKNTILDGIKHYKAKWRRRNSTGKDELDVGYDLSKLNPDGMDLHKLLKSGDVEFIGFCPDVAYIKEKGPAKHLEVPWLHQFGTPALLYKIKKYPALLIAAGNIRFNASALSEIDANNENNLLSGITG